MWSYIVYGVVMCYIYMAPNLILKLWQLKHPQKHPQNRLHEGRFRDSWSLRSARPGLDFWNPKDLEVWRAKG